MLLLGSIQAPSKEKGAIVKPPNLFNISCLTKSNFLGSISLPSLYFKGKRN
jgi:hypothetical protein